MMQALPNGQDDIVSVRIVRDPINLVCKGIGYILLSGTDAVFKALTLNKVNTSYLCTGWFYNYYVSGFVQEA